MPRSRDIRTNQAEVACDVCGRTLLRGEQAEPYIVGGARRLVCDLCTARAQHDGWIPEAEADEYALHRSRHDARGRSWLERVRGRRAGAREPRPEPVPAAEHAETGLEPDGGPPEPAAALPRPPRVPRHVRAVPTNADLKMQRALEVFNASEHVRTVAGVARSLGAPEVGVRPVPERPSVVVITVMWELSWYRYEIDLADEDGGVRRDAQGDELDELSADERAANAVADERGALQLAVGTT